MFKKKKKKKGEQKKRRNASLQNVGVYVCVCVLIGALVSRAAMLHSGIVSGGERRFVALGVPDEEAASGKKKKK